MAPNFWPAMKTTLARLRQRLDRARGRAGRRRWSRRPPGRAPRARRGSEKRATPMTRLLRRRALGHAGQRRPHLAGDAEHQDVARRRAPDRRPARGVGSVMKSSSAATLSKRSGRRRVMPPAARARPTGSLGAAGIGAWRRNPSPPPTAKPGQSSEPSASRPSAMRSRAGRRCLARRDRDGAATKAACSRLGRERHAVDEVMAVALDMGQPEQRDQRQVLLHADARPGGEVLGRHEVARAPASALSLRDARGVEDRLVEALAVLARDAGVAERQRRRERRQLAVGFVDDQRLQPWPAASTERDSATARLIGCSMNSVDCDQPRQRRRLAHCAATARRCPRRRRTARCRRAWRGSRRQRAVEHGGDAGQPLEVGLDVAADLQLVVAAAVVARRPPPASRAGRR